MLYFTFLKPRPILIIVQLQVYDRDGHVALDHYIAHGLNIVGIVLDDGLERPIPRLGLLAHVVDPSSEDLDASLLPHTGV